MEVEFLTLMDWNVYVDEEQSIAMAQALGCEVALKRDREQRKFNLLMLRMQRLESQRIKTVCEKAREIENAQVKWPHREERVRLEIEELRINEILDLQDEEDNARVEAEKSPWERRQFDDRDWRRERVLTEFPSHQWKEDSTSGARQIRTI